MNTKTSLRFLLALQHTKVVVLRNPDGLQVYADKARRNGHAVAAERISEALVIQ